MKRCSTWIIFSLLLVISYLSIFIDKYITNILFNGRDCRNELMPPVREWNEEDKTTAFFHQLFSRAWVGPDKNWNHIPSSKIASGYDQDQVQSQYPEYYKLMRSI